jgi:hypothetical protein
MYRCERHFGDVTSRTDTYGWSLSNKSLLAEMDYKLYLNHTRVDNTSMCCNKPVTAEW